MHKIFFGLSFTYLKKKPTTFILWKWEDFLNLKQTSQSWLLSEHKCRFYDHERNYDKCGQQCNFILHNYKSCKYLPYKWCHLSFKSGTSVLSGFISRSFSFISVALRTVKRARKNTNAWTVCRSYITCALGILAYSFVCVTKWRGDQHRARGEASRGLWYFPSHHYQTLNLWKTQIKALKCARTHAGNTCACKQRLLQGWRTQYARCDFRRFFPPARLKVEPQQAECDGELSIVLIRHELGVLGAPPAA